MGSPRSVRIPKGIRLPYVTIFRFKKQLYVNCQMWKPEKADTILYQVRCVVKFRQKQRNRMSFFNADAGTGSHRSCLGVNVTFSVKSFICFGMSWNMFFQMAAWYPRVTCCPANRSWRFPAADGSTGPKGWSVTKFVWWYFGTTYWYNHSQYHITMLSLFLKQYEVSHTFSHPRTISPTRFPIRSRKPNTGYDYGTGIPGSAWKNLENGFEEIHTGCWWAQ